MNRKSIVSWAPWVRSCITQLRGHEVIVFIERTSRQARHIWSEEVTQSKKRTRLGKGKSMVRSNRDRGTPYSAIICLDS